MDDALEGKGRALRCSNAQFSGELRNKKANPLGLAFGFSFAEA